jgi:hypothetical protein
MSRAEMEICRLVVPIAGSGRDRAEFVTGIARAGVDPKRHDGRSLSQANVGGLLNEDDHAQVNEACVSFRGSSRVSLAAAYGSRSRSVA